MGQLRTVNKEDIGSWEIKPIAFQSIVIQQKEKQVD